MEKALEMSSQKPSKVLIYNRPNMVKSTRHLKAQFHNFELHSKPAGYLKECLKYGSHIDELLQGKAAFGGEKAFLKAGDAVLNL